MKFLTYKYVLTILACILTLNVFAQSADLKIVIIRHGEKPAKGDNLNCKGLNRSMMLPKLLNSRFGVPNYTYVPFIKCDSSTKHSRMFQTVTPMAAKYNLVINSHYAGKDSTGIAHDILSKKGTVLVVWDHKYIPSMAHALGITKPVKWSDDDYDSIWIVTVSKNGVVMTEEKEGLLPAADCQ